VQPPRVDDRDDTEDEDNAAARDVGHCEEGMGMDREDGRDDDVGGGHVSYEEATAAADSYTTVHNAAAELWPRHLPLH